MNIIRTDIPDVQVIEPRVFSDARGFFFESFNQRLWHERTGLTTTFVQDNHSHSEKNVLRRLHQAPFEAKYLMRLGIFADRRQHSTIGFDCGCRKNLCTDYWAAQFESTILRKDSDLAIAESIGSFHQRQE